MKRFNKYLCLLPAALVALLCLVTGCGETAPGYQVKVVDALGNPIVTPITNEE